MKIELLLLFMLMAMIIEPSFACDASPNCLPNSTFVEIASLADEDAHNLGGTFILRDMMFTLSNWFSQEWRQVAAHPTTE